MTPLKQQRLLQKSWRSRRQSELKSAVEIPASLCFFLTPKFEMGECQDWVRPGSADTVAQQPGLAVAPAGAGCASQRHSSNQAYPHAHLDARANQDALPAGLCPKWPADNWHNDCRLYSCAYRCRWGDCIYAKAPGELGRSIFNGSEHCSFPAKQRRPAK